MIKFILKVEEGKAATLLALLNTSTYVKTKPLTPFKARVREGVREAVEEMNLVLAGKMDARNADEL